MRDKRSAKQNEYLLIAGFGLGQAGYVEPKITLNKGNAYGEKVVRTIECFRAGTKYAEVVAKAKEHAQQLGIQLGRNFTAEEWSGLEFGTVEHEAWRKAEEGRLRAKRNPRVGP